MTAFRCSVVLAGICCKCSRSFATGFALLPSHVVARTPIASVFTVSRRGFTFSPQRKLINPLLWKILSPVTKLSVFVAGRTLRLKYANLPPEGKRRVLFRIALVCLSFVVAASLYVYHHVETAPFTNRRRFVAVTKRQYEEIAAWESEYLRTLFETKMLTESDRRTQRVVRITKQLLRANTDLTLLNRDFAVHVINLPEINAFVLPGKHGDIFVFRGLLDVCGDSDDQLGIILAHELAHVGLGHGMEQLSRGEIYDLFIIVVLSALWTIIGPLTIAVITYGFMNRCLNALLMLPYSRTLEREADDFGLRMAARACFDVRESYEYWTKMAAGDYKEFGKQKLPWLKVVSTHPANEERADNLQKIIPECLEIRKACNCPPLPVDGNEKFSVAFMRLIDAQRKKVASLQFYT